MPPSPSSPGAAARDDGARAASHPKAFQPSPDLVEQVRAYFTVDGSSVPERLLPDGCVDLIFNLVEARGEPDAVIIGVTTGPRFVSPAPKERRFGVSFASGEAHRFLGCPMDVLRERIVDLREIFGGEGSRLIDDLRELPTDDLRVARMDRFLSTEAARRPLAPPCVRGSLGLLQARRGNVSIPDLARAIGVTERHLQRAFREQIGVAPKMMARIVRLHALLERLALAPVSSWTALAHESGFADQAHLNHEFKELTGSSPGAFVRGKRLSDFYNPTLGFDVTVQACSRDDCNERSRPRTP